MGGQGPITYQAISLYARDMGISGDDFRLFSATLRLVDAEWLDHVAATEKAEDEIETKHQ